MVRIKKLFLLRLCGVSLIVLICLYFKEDIHNYLEPERGLWFENRIKMIYNFNRKKNSERFSLVNRKNVAPICNIPELDPFGKDALREWAYRKREYCDVKKFAFIKNGRLVVNNTNNSVLDVKFDYIIRGRKKKPDGGFDPPTGDTGYITDETYKYDDVINDDFHVHFTKAVPLSYNKQKKLFYSPFLKKDFIRLHVKKKDGTYVKEYHPYMSKPNLTCGKHGRPLSSRPKGTKGLPFNVHMIMVDAQSVANMHRQVPKLMDILETDVDTMLFKAHGIHGDGTTCQLMATLAGYLYKQEEVNPWQPPNNKSCDSIDLIFKDFNRAGYTTLYNEDFVVGSTFHYKLNGFENPPSDWYPRPYWMAAHEKVMGCGKIPCVCEDQEMLHILKTFTTECAKEAKFSIQVLANAHDDMNRLFQIENELIDILKFFKDDSRREDTIVILFSDHGARTGATGDFRNTKEGRLEEYMPFYSIILPPSFKHDYPSLFENMKMNTDVLTSHFDVHMTLKHLLSYPKLPAKMTYGQSLFSRIDPQKRTCNQTGIPARYCFCSKTNSMTVDSSQSRLVAHEAIKYINTKLMSYGDDKEGPRSLCAVLTLKEIISLEYTEGTSGDETHSESIEASTVGHVERVITYNIMLRVSPSDATFDIRVRKIGGGGGDYGTHGDSSGVFVVDPEISRTNLYRNQPACIQMKYPKLAPFCYCKSLLKS